MIVKAIFIEIYLRGMLIFWRGIRMDHKEWVDKLRWLSPEQIVQVHFGLQEDIKKFYKMRGGR
ncbi:hypothetical protein HWQ14_00055 [Enterobacter cloacae]|uniref:Uncharacterized protein n=1 Tax=Enterobacter cloacae TaxID=550 RepID=A0A7H8U8H4_ENTCL|nr:hypothetical protein [Enterobacter cloacae]QKZ96213.1 hypothetical protein HWQ14_00055 [Enterobacter cloacae]